MDSGPRSYECGSRVWDLVFKVQGFRFQGLHMFAGIRFGSVGFWQSLLSPCLASCTNTRRPYFGVWWRQFVRLLLKTCKNPQNYPKQQTHIRTHTYSKP